MRLIVIPNRAVQVRVSQVQVVGRNGTFCETKGPGPGPRPSAAVKFRYLSPICEHASLREESLMMAIGTAAHVQWFMAAED